jgi:lysophospholipid acyltransferase (LPLAT)-like uncharacterized protein
MVNRKDKLKLAIITTADIRGNYIHFMCKHYGYNPIRLPNEVKDGNLLFKLRRFANIDYDISVTLDGPLGPYHEPKLMVLSLAFFLGRCLVPISVRIKYKYKLKNRWDKYVILLPFNKIEYYIGEPLMVGKQVFTDNFEIVKNKIKNIMGDCLIE